MLDKDIIKISSIWSHNIEESIIFHILKKISKKNIQITSPNNADIIFIGPYNYNTFLDKYLKKFKKINFVKKLFPNLKAINFRRKFKPLKVYFSEEGYLGSYDFEYDFHITPLFDILNENHLRFPIWKDFIDWTDEGFPRSKYSLNGKRFGSLYDLNILMKPQGSSFLKKENKVSFITSHLNFPRNVFYNKLKEIIDVDGYGKIFNPSIKNHNSSDFYKFDILKKYRFNLCPHNLLMPGYYDEKIPDAFISKSIPITWCDNNVKKDFNPNCFINLVNFASKEIKLFRDQFEDELLLKKYSEEPLLTYKPNLDKEIDFCYKILNSL